MTATMTASPRNQRSTFNSLLSGAAGLVALGTLGMLSCAPGEAGDLSDPPSDFMLLATSGVQGFIEPCGCVAGQIGGIDRLTSYVEDRVAEHDATLFVDLGDLVARHWDPDPALADQLPLKAEAFFRVWSELGCAAMAVGETDLALGIDTLLPLSEQFGLPLLNANVVDAAGEPVFRESIVVERGGKRIGLFSVLAPGLMEDEIDHGEGGTPVRPVNVRAIVEAEGHRLLPWKETARRIVADLEPRCDLLIAAAHLGFERNKELASLFPSIDVVIGPHWGGSESEVQKVQGTLVLVPFAKGGRMAQLEFWWRDEDAYFRPKGWSGPGPLTNISSRNALRTDILVEGLSTEDLSTRAPEMDAERLALQLSTHETMRARYEEAFEALGPFPEEGNLFSFDLVPMYSALRRSEHALSVIDDYHDATHAFWEERRPAEPQASKLFVGPGACEECHPAQVEFWMATPHSYAIAALEATAQDADAECIGCHSVGYQKPGGFRHPGQRAPFVNVRCAACHGPGGRHAAGGVAALDKQLMIGSGRLDCLRCHNSEHDPNFGDHAVEKLTAVACPPMDGPGEGAPELLRTYLAAAMSLERIQPEGRPWFRVTEAYRMAGAHAAEVQSARAWSAAMPGSRRARLALGEALSEGADEEPLEALAIFQAVIAEDEESVRAWLGYGELMLGRNDAEALLAGKEALSLANGRVEAIRLVVRALLALGQTEEARLALETHLEFHPTHAVQLADLVP